MPTTEAPGEDKGMISRLGDSMGGILNTILSLPDKPESFARRKAARIAFDILIIGGGIGVFALMNYGKMDALANPSLMTMMSMPMFFAASGVGIAWLIQDVVGKKYQRIAAQIGALLLPAFIIGASVALMKTGFHVGLTGSSINTYLLVGILILPLSCFAVAKAIKILGQADAPKFVNGRPPRIKNPKRNRREGTGRQGTDEASSNGKISSYLEAKSASQRVHAARKKLPILKAALPGDDELPPTDPFYANNF